jgi:hypothetical protein
MVKRLKGAAGSDFNPTSNVNRCLIGFDLASSMYGGISTDDYAASKPHEDMGIFMDFDAIG